MAERHVIGVEHVLDLELPVAVVDVAVHADVERERPVRRAVDEVVDVALHRADMVLEARPAGRRGSRTRSRGIRRCAARGRGRMSALSKPSRAAFRHRHVHELAVGVVGPAVIAADQPRRVALALVDHLGAAVGAAVEQDVHAAVAVARHDHRLAPELGGDVVARDSAPGWHGRRTARRGRRCAPSPARTRRGRYRRGDGRGPARSAWRSLPHVRCAWNFSRCGIQAAFRKLNARDTKFRIADRSGAAAVVIVLSPLAGGN